MANFDFVEVFDACEDLMEESASFTILKTPLFHNIVEELTSGCVLHYQK